MSAFSALAGRDESGNVINHDKITDMARKTKRHDDNPERAVLDHGKKRAPLSNLDAPLNHVCYMSRYSQESEKLQG